MNDSDTRPTYICTQWIFLRAIGVIYLLAFLSMGLQVNGLIGSEGIQPAAYFMAVARESLPPALGFWHLPTLLWFNSSDWFIQALCWGGALASVGVILSFATAPLLFVCWLFYLSIVNVGQDFLSFQWDVLLLETGFLAIFWAPWQWIGPPWKHKLLLEPDTKTSLVVLWLLRWLLFRLMFMSGAVKLLSGDVAWRDLTALKYHYLTQPLPTPLAWFANQWPAWFQSASVAAMFFVELMVPFMFFLPRPWRYFAAAFTASLQVLILLTGNYTFFNLLTLALCLTLLDDGICLRAIPSRIKTFLIAAADETIAVPVGRFKQLFRRAVVAWLTGLIAFATLTQLSQSLGLMNQAPLAVQSALGYVGAFHIVNSYGLFAVMTKTRPEIIVEGSNDGTTWTPYLFKYKPGPLDRPPPIVAPYQPRLDWQMWFAALGTVEDNQWFKQFVYRLLQPSPSVVQLLERDPFASKAPKFIRASLYDYQFTDFGEWQKTHDWWKRTYVGEYMPAVSIENFVVK